MQAAKTLFSLLRASVCGVDHGAKAQCDANKIDLPRLYSLAKQHDIAHLLAAPLGELGMLGDDEISAKLQKKQMVAVFRAEQMTAVLDDLKAALEAAEIPFIPLKGSVLREYYREPWMRTSCDIDVLVKESDLSRADDVLVSALACEKKYDSEHDVSYYTPNGVHIELHYKLMESGTVPAAEPILARVWEMTIPVEGYRFWYRMRDEMFYFYHIVHMAKHFQNGGCGIRSFLDLWILEHRVPHVNEARAALLLEGNMTAFAAVAERLTAFWLDGAESDATALKMESYILGGGTYGSREGYVSVQQVKRGGKWRFFIARVFLPYDMLKHIYPVLKKHKWLTPLMQMRRWLALLFGGGAKRIVQIMKTNQSISRDQRDETAQFLSEIGLQ